MRTSILALVGLVGCDASQINTGSDLPPQTPTPTMARPTT